MLPKNHDYSKARRIMLIKEVLPLYCDTYDANHIVNQVRWWSKFKKVNFLIGRKGRHVESL